MILSDKKPATCSNSAMPKGPGAQLVVSRLQSGYGKRVVLKEISLEVPAGTVVALIGPNGSGKSTMVKTLFGLVKPTNGTIDVDGVSSVGLKPMEMVKLGVVYVPQGNRVFSDLSVGQNLSVAVRGLSVAEMKRRIEELGEVLPAIVTLKDREAGTLSGGEKQQVSLAMGLIKKPKLLLLDEPSLGLAPDVMQEMFARLRRFNEHSGTSILIVEHKVRAVLGIVDRVIGLRRGEIVNWWLPGDVGKDDLKDLFLG